MELKQCGPEDLARLREIAEQTYRETFAPHNSRADMDAYVAEAFSVERLRHELRNAHSAFFLALEEGGAVGYMKLNDGPAQTEPDLDGSLEIERIYMLAACHGNGGGRQMLDHAVARAMAAGKDFIWLGVWEHNHRAIRFYEKNGFARFGMHPFRMGEDVQVDLLMRRELRGQDGPDNAGVGGDMGFGPGRG